MPYRVEWEPGGACKRFFGFLTESEFVRSSEEISAAEQFDSLRYIISDYSAVTGHSITADGVEAVAALRLGGWVTNPNIRSIVVAADTSPGSIGEVARLRPLLKLNQTFWFATRQEADEWLSSQPPLFKARANQLSGLSVASLAPVQVIYPVC